MASDDNQSSGRTNTSVWQMRGALVFVAAVWVLGCVWSFQEQTHFAASLGFSFAPLLPAVIDGLAAAMAGVAWAASLDARPAVPARLATLLAVAASSVSNGVWADQRTAHNVTAVAVAVGIPVAANLAFEVLLAELRRQVQRSRGLPPPVAIPHVRAIRFVLSPWRTFFSWRRTVLALTDIEQPDTAVTPAVIDAEVVEPDPVLVQAKALAEELGRTPGRPTLMERLGLSDWQARELAKELAKELAAANGRTDG